MDFHKGNKDFTLISNAYGHVIKRLPAPSPRTAMKSESRGEPIVRGYVNLDLQRCIRPYIIDVRGPNAGDKYKYQTLSTEDKIELQPKEFSNPYQAKINYFQTAMHNSNINSVLSDRKDSKKKLKSYVKNSTVSNTKKIKSIKHREKTNNRAQTPLTNDPPAYEKPEMGSSQSVKYQITLKSELWNVNPKEAMQKQIMLLNEKVKLLEYDNKKLHDENTYYKNMHARGKQNEPKRHNSHYKPEWKKMNQREDSKTSTQYKHVNFNNTNKFSDFVRSCSFENSSDSNVKIRNETLQNYVPSRLNGKENIKNNIDIEKKSKQNKPISNESVLIQKVSRILEKREMNKTKPNLTPRIKVESSGNAYVSMKHSKNEIINRINNKYRQRME
jgi:hypothetical protein